MKLLAFAALLTFVARVADAGTLSVTAIDSEGAIIPHSHVIVHWDPAGLKGVRENVGIPDDKATTANSSGHSAFELPAGVYDVFIAATGFSPHCEKVSLKRTETRELHVTLKTSRLLTVTVD